MSQLCAYDQKDKVVYRYLEQSTDTSVVTSSKFTFSNLREYECSIFGYEPARIDNYANQIFICCKNAF